MSDNVMVLTKGAKCPDYPKVQQMSVQCQNCRYNRFIDGNISDQKCLPHSATDAKRKGAPGQAPASHFEEWMDAVERRRIKSEYAKMNEGVAASEE